MTHLLGLGLPAAMWRTYTDAEVAAILDLRPQACLSIVFHDSPLVAQKIAQDAWLWEQLGRPPWTCRFYTGKLSDWKPEDLALELYIMDSRYRGLGMAVRWCAWNEWNIEAKGLEENWERLIEFAYTVEAGVHMRNPKIPLDLPALSPTGNYRQGLEAMGEAGMEGYTGVNIHSYTEAQLQDVALAQGLFPGKDVVVTEVNSMAPSFYAPKLESLGCHESHWFLLSGESDMRQYFLMGSPYYDDFKAMTHGIENDPLVSFHTWAGITDSTAGGDMAEYVLGFKELAEALGQKVVGDPQTNQLDLPAGSGTEEIALQVTSKGLMVYGTGGQPFFLAGKFARSDIPLP